ncbi:MAG TPA: class D sortase [Anaerolineae bacterium]|nr:class D sortase [Anaerolineae bacterium]HQH39151.1 class D sortase [Anaerolineae bacterium]
MKDHRYVDELSLEELEEVLQVRRRDERLKRMQSKSASLDPLRDQPPPPVQDLLPARQATTGASAGTRYSAVIELGKPKRARRPIKWRWVGDQFLLIIEIVALLGLLFVVARMFTTVQGINEESRATQMPPTPTSAPFIGVVVLPGGHTPPDAQRQSEPAPIPAHLQGLVAAITPLPVPTAGPEHPQRIVIPAINVDAPVVEGDDWEALKKGAGHHIGSANPGERGNSVISAHNDIYGEIFRDLPELNVGDEILVQTQTQVYRYRVEQTRIIEPTDVSVMASTTTPVLTLITCYPYGIDSHRIVVIAGLQP